MMTQEKHEGAPGAERFDVGATGAPARERRMTATSTESTFAGPAMNKLDLPSPAPHMPMLAECRPGRDGHKLRMADSRTVFGRARCPDQEDI